MGIVFLLLQFQMFNTLNKNRKWSVKPHFNHQTRLSLMSQLTHEWRNTMKGEKNKQTVFRATAWYLVLFGLHTSAACVTCDITETAACLAAFRQTLSTETHIYPTSHLLLELCIKSILGMFQKVLLKKSSVQMGSKGDLKGQQPWRLCLYNKSFIPVQ